ncbi:MAG: peptidoglycan-binding protein LysM [Desulfovibrionaceae bacterium]|nr:peptidoglycan-binding protein LysM [Desulfovibrionaceae bacterium]
MGLVSFMKDVGDKLFGSGKANAAELKKDLDSLELETKDLQVEVEDDKVVLKGEVKDQETLEKAILQVGNKKGVASVNTDNVTVAKPAEDSTFYEVKPGDSLWKIAKQFYGNGNEYMRIFNANRPMLKNPDLIYDGQKLRIPPREEK